MIGTKAQVYCLSSPSCPRAFPYTHPMITILTNDDGIDAPGIAALAEAVGGDALVVAPHEHVSECSHRVTTKRPLRVEQRGPRKWAVEGLPADCTRVALLHLLPSLGHAVERDRVRVLSGINAGGNLGADIYISGTVAAVREATFFGIPAIAFSQYRRGQAGRENWKRAARWTRRVLAELDRRPLEPGAFWNVNFPCLDDHDAEPELVFCERSRHPLPVKYEFDDEALHYIGKHYHERTREPGSDVDVCFGGHIAISKVHL